MTQSQNQKNCKKYYVDMNINNSIKKTFSFNEKSFAYDFIINKLKPVANFYSDDKSALLSGILYSLNKNNTKHVHLKKNLTKVYFNESNKSG